MRRLITLPVAALAFSNRAPPLHLPQVPDSPAQDLPPGTLPVEETLQLKLRSCGGRTMSLDPSAPTALLFLEAGSTFSEKQFSGFERLAEKYPAVRFIAVESFSLAGREKICEEVRR